jgi:hypothetical protein
MSILSTLPVITQMGVVFQGVNCKFVNSHH